LEFEERAQFETIVLPHADAAFNLARWLTRDDHAAEDLVQEAFLRAARYFRSLRGNDARPWLLGIVRRVTYDWLRSHSATVTLDVDVHDQEDSSMNPVSLVIQNWRQEQLQQALEQLSPSLREVVVLRDLEQLSYQQIAAVIDCPIGTVTSRLSRGRRLLQLQLMSILGEES
jgi:RNA polymerase sigma factor (sigma-70 family)